MINTVLDERFRIEENLARSANSEVFRGMDLQTSEAVALKLIRPRFLASENFGARLKQEFQVLHNLDHPNVVKVIQIGQTRDNMIYFAMEYVRGSTLRKVVEHDWPLARNRTADFVGQIADALDHAHRQKVVHRDINPDNIMVHQDADGKETLKIFDFGLAKVLDVEPENAMVQTGAAVVQGSPEFMSPEQAMGKGVSSASDIYSLGVLGFFMLTADVPFKGANDLDTIIGHVQKPVPSIREVNPDADIPDSVQQVIQYVLAKDPKDRPPTAGEFANLLRQALGGAKVTTPTPSTNSQSQRTGRSRGRIAASASSSAATAVASRSGTAAAQHQAASAGNSPASGSAGLVLFIVALVICIGVLVFLLVGSGGA